MVWYAPTSNAEDAEVEWFYEDLQDLLELTPKKDVLFIMGDCNAKVGSQGKLDKPRQPMTKQKHHIWTKEHIFKAMFFSDSHGWI